MWVVDFTIIIVFYRGFPINLGQIVFLRSLILNEIHCYLLMALFFFLNIRSARVLTNENKNIPYMEVLGIQKLHSHTSDGPVQAFGKLLFGLGISQADAILFNATVKKPYSIPAVIFFNHTPNTPKCLPRRNQVIVSFQTSIILY